MHFPAPLATAVEIRVTDVGSRLERVWRISRAIGEDGVKLRRDLPWEAGRPVALTLTLPDDTAPLVCAGVVRSIAPDDEEAEGEQARPRAIELTSLDPDARQRLLAYVEERTR